MAEVPNGDGRRLTGLQHDFVNCAKRCELLRQGDSREHDTVVTRITNLETDMGAMNTRVSTLEETEKHRKTDLSAKSTMIVALLVFLGTVLPRVIDYLEKVTTR